MSYGANLYTYLKVFRAGVLKSNITRRTNIPWTDSESIVYLNQSLRHIQRVKRLVPKRSASTTITSADTDYALPTDRLSTALSSIRLRKTDSSTYKLTYLPYDRFCEAYNIADLTDDSGDPVHWTFDHTTYGQVLIRPVPTWTQASSVIFDYIPGLADISRAYFSSVASITATTVYNSTSVTLSGTPATSAILADWEVGFIPTTDLDGTSVSNAVPAEWYGVASTVTSTTLTLKDAYKIIGASGLNFIAAEVSELEKFAPGECGMAPAHWAARNYLMNIGDPAYEMQQRLALEIVPGLDVYVDGGTADELAWESDEHVLKGEVSWL